MDDALNQIVDNIQSAWKKSKKKGLHLTYLMIIVMMPALWNRSFLDFQADNVDLMVWRGYTGGNAYSLQQKELTHRLFSSQHSIRLVPDL